MEMIAGRTPGPAFKAEGLSYDDTRAVRRCVGAEMPVEICPAAGVEHTVGAEPSGPSGRVRACDRCALITMKDTVGNRHDHGRGRADDVDTGVRVLPRRIPKSLADVQRRTVHRRTHDAAGRCGAGDDRAAGTRRVTTDADQLRTERNQCAAHRHNDNPNHHNTRTTSHTGGETAGASPSAPLRRPTAGQRRQRAYGASSGQGCANDCRECHA